MPDEQKITLLESRIENLSQRIEAQNEYCRDLQEQIEKANEELEKLYQDNYKTRAELASLKNKDRKLYAVLFDSKKESIEEFDSIEESFLFIKNEIKDCIKNKERLRNILIEINPSKKMKL